MATPALDSMSLGKAMPHFELEDVITGKKVSSVTLKEAFPKGVVIIFLCRHCPYVQHLLEGIIDIAKAFLPQGIGFVGVSANDPTDYPDDCPEGLRAMALEHEIPFPILFDETQEVARSFEASCTPDFFVFQSVSRLDRFKKSYSQGGARNENIAGPEAAGWPAQGSPEASLAGASESNQRPAVYSEKRVEKHRSDTAIDDYNSFEKILAYHGRFDGSTHKNGIAVTGEDLKQALEAVLTGASPRVCLPSLGCSIKWKKYE